MQRNSLSVRAQSSWLSSSLSADGALYGGGSFIGGGAVPCLWRWRKGLTAFIWSFSPVTKENTHIKIIWKQSGCSCLGHNTRTVKQIQFISSSSYYFIKIILYKCSNATIGIQEHSFEEHCPVYKNTPLCPWESETCTFSLCHHTQSSVLPIK